MNKKLFVSIVGGFALVMVILSPVQGLTQRLVNPFFTNASKTGWFTNGPTTEFFVNGGQPLCAADEAYVGSAVTGSSAEVFQCVLLPPHGTMWGLSADMKAASGTQAIVSASYHTSSNCLGTPLHTDSISTTSATMTKETGQFSYDTAANSIQTIRVSLSAVGLSFRDAPEACFDNLWLDDAGQTAVAVRDMGTTNSQSPLLLAGLLLVLVTAWVANKRVD